VEDHLNRKSKSHQNTNLPSVRIGKFKQELIMEQSMLIKTVEKHKNINTLSTIDMHLTINSIFMNKEELPLFLLLNHMEPNLMLQEVGLPLKTNLEF